MNEPDEYAAFQSDLAVYHDDYGDYSTNEPTMDGTASLIYLLAAKEDESNPILGWPISNFNKNSWHATIASGALIRGDSTQKKITLVFTADEYAEGLPVIQKTLADEQVKASFFFTGRLYRNKQYQPIIKELYRQKHYLGPHSDQHILYNDWKNRDSMLVTRDSLEKDYQQNISAMKALGIYKINQLPYFIPPYEWWNKKVEDLSKGMSQKLQFVTTVLHEPKLIILDEPFSGLDPLNANLIKDEIFGLAQRGSTIIFSTHRMEQVEEICNHIVLVNLGKKVLDGSVSGIKQNFKENKFSIKLQGEQVNANNPAFTILEEKQGGYVLKINEGFKSNDILAHFLQQGVTIEAFNEILPSLNEIFIRLVEGSNAKTRSFQQVD